MKRSMIRKIISSIIIIVMLMTFTVNSFAYESIEDATNASDSVRTNLPDKDWRYTVELYLTCGATPAEGSDKIIDMASALGFLRCGGIPQDNTDVSITFQIRILYLTNKGKIEEFEKRFPPIDLGTITETGSFYLGPEYVTTDLLPSDMVETKSVSASLEYTSKDVHVTGLYVDLTQNEIFG